MEYLIQSSRKIKYYSNKEQKTRIDISEAEKKFITMCLCTTNQLIPAQFIDHKIKCHIYLKSSFLPTSNLCIFLFIHLYSNQFYYNHLDTNKIPLNLHHYSISLAPFEMKFI